MAKFASLSITQYLKDLASNKPIPGGGSAVACGAALGAALSLMVARFSVRKQKTPENQEALSQLTRALEKLVPQMTRVMDEDPRVFSKVAKCYALSRNANTDGKKRAARLLMDNALSSAFQVQASLALLIVMALRVNRDLRPLASGSVANDLNVSQGLLRGAFEGAVSTCEINLKYLEDVKRKEPLSAELNKLKQEFEGVQSSDTGSHAA